ncbi:MAG: hypothetical protein BMS9Abin26_1859 [Gammaproteobacteria bacterium]|nr:MAG: hypothetical protein BMS9Abin26_1859 [Gammaproteobacteria bacterium]
MSIYSVDKLIAQARTLAADYRKATGKPLPGVSAEIAEHDAAHYLNLELCPHPRESGYDAVVKEGDCKGKRIQIKSRVIFDEARSGQRIGQIKVEQEWDSVALVILDEEYEAIEIHEADREAILEALDGGNSKRSRRGAMTLAKFKVIGHLLWSRENGPEDEVWDNKVSV